MQDRDEIAVRRRLVCSREPLLVLDRRQPALGVGVTQQVRDALTVRVRGSHSQRGLDRIGLAHGLAVLSHVPTLPIVVGGPQNRTGRGSRRGRRRPARSKTTAPADRALGGDGSAGACSSATAQYQWWRCQKAHALQGLPYVPLI